MEENQRIRRAIVNRLLWDSRVRASGIDVIVDNDNNIKLDGMVRSINAKMAAEDLAWSVSGVRDVENNISVQPDQNFIPVSDEQIETSVSTLIRMNDEIESKKIEVNSKKGKIMINGVVSSLWEKELAEYLARSVIGVVTISNNLVVVPKIGFNDVELAERIKARLMDNPLVNFDQLDIKIENGAVSIFGDVPNWETWQEVYYEISYTDGVINVIDNMNVGNNI